MAQINLLGAQEKTTNYAKALSSFIAKILALILVLVLAYYAFLFVKGNSQTKQVAKLEQEITRVEQDIQTNSDKNQVFTRQAQLKDLGLLARQHIYWSGIIPELARVTLKTASYTSFLSKENGDISMVVEVPSYEELDKFLQVFDLPQYNQQVNNVRVDSVTKVQKDDALRISAKVTFSYKTDSLRKLGK
jgi:hypothetical protein